MSDRIKTYREFYRFYLKEHQNTTSRMLHFTGTFFVLVLLLPALFYNWRWEWLFLPLVGYGFAWVGHALFEKNKPATFRYPLWSLLSDFKLFFEILLGRRKFKASGEQ